MWNIASLGFTYSHLKLVYIRIMERHNSRQIIKLFLELIHQVALDVTVVVCAEDSDRSDPLRITQFVAPSQVYHLIFIPVLTVAK